MPQRKIKNHYPLFPAATEETPGSRKLLVSVWHYFVFVFKEWISHKSTQMFHADNIFPGLEVEPAICS